MAGQQITHPIQIQSLAIQTSRFRIFRHLVEQKSLVPHGSTNVNLDLSLLRFPHGFFYLSMAYFQRTLTCLHRLVVTMCLPHGLCFLIKRKCQVNRRAGCRRCRICWRWNLSPCTGRPLATVTATIRPVGAVVCTRSFGEIHTTPLGSIPGIAQHCGYIEQIWMIRCHSFGLEQRNQI